MTDLSDRVSRFGLKPEPELLAESARGDGLHCVLKIELAGRPLVLKVYGRKRDRLRDFLRDVGHRVLIGKTGMTPLARRRTVRETLALWRAHGFDVPATVDAPLPATVPPNHLLCEFVPGRLLHLVIADRSVPLAEKSRLLATLAREWSRRHALALALREPRLIQSHAFLGHVIHVAAGTRKDGGDSGERLVTFDFEVAWARRAAIPRLISLELAQQFDSLTKWAPREQFESLLASFVRAYPERPRLERMPADVRSGRLPLLAPITRLGLALRERGPGRKRAMLAAFEQALRETRT